MKILYPVKNMRITQGYGVGTHRGTYDLDDGGKDAGIDDLYAPFDGYVKKIWNNGHTVWLESSQVVEYADGTKDYACYYATHDNDVTNLRVGQFIKQNQVFYQEGTSGNASGNHVHHGLGKGKFTGTGWHQNSYGYWTINNAYKPERAFFVDGKILNSGGLSWKATQGDTMAKDTTIHRVFEMGLSRKADSGALTTYRKTTDEVLVNSVYTSAERKNKLAELGMTDGNWVKRIAGLIDQGIETQKQLETEKAKVEVLKGTINDKNEVIEASEKVISDQEKVITELNNTIAELQDELAKEEPCDCSTLWKAVQCWLSNRSKKNGKS